jgi:DNA-binding transcriptional ArsR family regulator
MFLNNTLRFKIFERLVRSKSMLRISDLSRLLREPPQKIIYHLPVLEQMGLIIHDEETNQWFCQPLFLNERIHELCSEKVADVLEFISENELDIVEVDGIAGEDVVMNCVYALFFTEIHAKSLN